MARQYNRQNSVLGVSRLRDFKKGRKFLVYISTYSGTVRAVVRKYFYVNQHFNKIGQLSEYDPKMSIFVRKSSDNGVYWLFS